MSEQQLKSVKVSISDHKWLMNKKLEQKLSTAGDVIHQLIEAEKSRENTKTE